MEKETIFINTEDPADVVTLPDILGRYLDINGTVDGFEEYVKSGFMNGNNKEYKGGEI